VLSHRYAAAAAAAAVVSCVPCVEVDGDSVPHMQHLPLL